VRGALEKSTMLHSSKEKFLDTNKQALWLNKRSNVRLGNKIYFKGDRPLNKLFINHNATLNPTCVNSNTRTLAFSNTMLQL
jgi:hypothetical protein